MALTDLFLRTLKSADKVQKFSDGGGLYLHVTVAGGKFWRMAYRFEQKQKTLSLGAYPAVSLKEARRRRDEAKEELARRRYDAKILAKGDALILETAFIDQSQQTAVTNEMINVLKEIMPQIKELNEKLRVLNTTLTIPEEICVNIPEDICVCDFLNKMTASKSKTS